VVGRLGPCLVSVVRVEVCHPSAAVQEVEELVSAPAVVQEVEELNRLEEELVSAPAVAVERDWKRRAI